jgi:hypothetical protein
MKAKMEATNDFFGVMPKLNIYLNKIYGLTILEIKVLLLVIEKVVAFIPFCYGKSKYLMHYLYQMRMI